MLFKRLFRAFSGGLTIFLLLTGSSLAEGTGDKIKIMEPWARATIGGIGTSAAYMKIVNKTGKAVVLNSIETKAAGMVEFHTHKTEKGVVQMVKIEDPINIPAGGEFSFVPGGDHIMLMGVAKPLTDGASISLKLNFDGNQTVRADIPVKKVAPKAHMHGHKHKGHRGSHSGN